MIQTATHSLMDRVVFNPGGGYIEDSAASAGAESPRRFHKPSSENTDPLGRSSGPYANMPSLDPRINHARRRSTLREASKPALLGPRPLEPGKRDSHYQSGPTSFPNPGQQNVAFTPSPVPLYNPASNYNPRLPTTQSTAAASEGGSSTGSTDFLPSLSFDDLHTSLTGVDFEINRYPMLSSLASNQNSISISTLQGESDAKAQGKDQGARISRSGSLVRRFSNARRQLSQSSINTESGMPPPALASTTASRGRRQSTLNSAHPQNAAARQPRKSVGPGYLPQSKESRLPPSQSQPSLVRSGSISKPSSGLLLPNGDALSTPRSSRIKSLQPPPRGQTQNFLQAAPADHAVSSPRPRGQGAQTPSGSNNSNRRLSTLYVGGLGARTISPTDARRLKRLSAAPKMPSIQIPTVSQPDLVSSVRQTAQSPAAFARKTSTPSSARNTPDFSRRPVAALPAVPNPTLSSLRVNTNSRRNSQVLSSSRLPTAKPRNVHSSTGFVDEEVPPVPAIPKAYESPKDQHVDASYFAIRKPAVSDSDDHSNRSLPGSRPGTSSKAMPQNPPDFTKGHSKQGSTSRHRRGLTIGAGSDERPPVSQPNLSKKNLQPLRLPPLNLLPLSTPTASRIASFPAPSGEIDARHSTPPPKRNITKTPSTPLTASKATFFPRDDGDFPTLYNFRSSSSHHPVRPNGVDAQPSQFDLGAPIPIPTAGPRTAASPFASNSLPKLHDFGPLSTTPVASTPVEIMAYTSGFTPGADVDFAHAQSPKIVPQVVHVANQSTRTSSSDEPSTPASTNSLRRKLSLSWKRSSSKASQRVAGAAANAEKEEAKSRHEMPPPKIPASATWSSRNSADIASSRPSLDNRKKVSNNAHQPDGETAAQSSGHGQKQDAAPPPYSDRRQAPRSASTSILTPVQRMLGSKGSLSALRSRNLDTNLDKDDLAADKLMEKLASKRKDFEHAAKEVDELRRRAHPKDRVVPSQAIKMVNLNIFERGEIEDYKEVFFCGTRNAKKIVGDVEQAMTNFGYDDERGDYNIILGDHLAYRYEIIDVLGKGSFGQVVRCIDHKTGGLVAVKIIRNKKRFHQQALVEVNILQKLREWDPDNKHSMINFTQSFYFRGHLCISTELLGMNLYEFIKAYEFKGFPLLLIRRFTKQILSSLILLKSKRVIHCDLKPENILLAHPLHSEIKVIDFGSSCFENEKVYTYIQSRFYRSPEVILGMSYGIPIDMWSLGCILAELYTGYPVFPGENEQEQLACIMEIFGPPEKHLIEKSSRKKLFFDSMGKPRVTVSSKGRRRRPSSKTLSMAIKCDDEAFLDFLSQCLRWDPEKRLKPDAALQHEFATGVKRPSVPAGSRPAGRGVYTTISGGPSASASPMKRYANGSGAGGSASSSTMAGGQQRREPSGAVRPLPDPPPPGLRVGGRPPVSSSPIKPAQGASARGGPASDRRHSSVTGGGPAPGGSAAAQGGGPAGRRAHGPAVGGPQGRQGGRRDLAAGAQMGLVTASVGKM